MTLQQINDMAQVGGFSLLIILLGMIKIPHIEINFWKWLGRGFGRVINGEVLTQVAELKKDLNEFKKEAELERVRQARQRILRFNDEILFEKRHSKEHFDEILDDINVYERYCREHKEYENNKAVLAISTIKEVYQECMDTHDFLTYNKKMS